MQSHRLGGGRAAPTRPTEERNGRRTHARFAEAVFFYLQNMLARVTIRDEAGLNGKEIGEAIAWAMATLIENLRRRNAAGVTAVQDGANTTAKVKSVPARSGTSVSLPGWGITLLNEPAENGDALLMFEGRTASGA